MTIIEFTNREVLEWIAAGFGFIVAMLAWHFLDNRTGHNVIHKRITDENQINSERLLDIYKQVGGKPNGEKHWQ